MELSEGGNEGPDGRPDTRLDVCSAELVGAGVGDGDSTAELREEGFESRPLGRERVRGLVGDPGLMELIKTLGVVEAIVVVTGGGLERGAVGSVELESVVFPS